MEMLQTIRGHQLKLLGYEFIAVLKMWILAPLYPKDGQHGCCHSKIFFSYKDNPKLLTLHHMIVGQMSE